MDHVLLLGPRVRKTTLEILLQRDECKHTHYAGPAIEKPGDLAAVLTNLSEGDVLCTDSYD